MGDIDDALSFPILTEEVSFPGKARPGTTGAPGSSQFGQIVEGTLRDVLGWRARENDPMAFVAALKKSFDSTQVQGHTEWKWTAHTYSIETNMGAVTGAQAAIFSRAKVALNQSLPLLDGLQTLLAASDLQEVEADTSIVRSSLTELVNELGQEGGPRLTRVDDYFVLLLGPTPNLNDTEKVGGQLGVLRDTFGLFRRNVNTIAEEQNLTNFLILVDHVNALKLTWDSQKHFFDRDNTDVFLGTQLVLLSRTLAVIAESVQEAYFIFDSLFLGPAQREVTSLDLGTGSPVYLGELLQWVEHFAVNEGPRLVREGGKNGLIFAFTPMVKRLADLVKAAADLAFQPSSNPLAAYHSKRSWNTLTSLASDLSTALRLARQIRREPPPTVTLVDPEEAEKGGSVRLTINGSDFQDGAKVTLKSAGQPDLVASEEIVIHEAEIKARVNLAGVEAGTVWTIVVTNFDDQIGKLAGSFSVTGPEEDEEPPDDDEDEDEDDGKEEGEVRLTGFSPDELVTDINQVLTITGENFDTGNAKVEIRLPSSGTTLGGVIAPGQIMGSSTDLELTVSFDLAGAALLDDAEVSVQNDPSEPAVAVPGTLTISEATGQMAAKSPPKKK